jgi:putative cell wall-binding protein
MSYMSTRARSLRVRTATVAAALCSGLLVVASAAPAAATADVTPERLAGLDRFETAAAIAAAGFPDGSDTVVVASGRAFPDALAGAALGLPILLTEPTELPDATADAIGDLEATDVIILGGTAAVSSGVESDIEDLGVETSRLAGQDRYETAGAIAGSFDDTDVADLNGKPTAIVATGRDFADALAGGPLATSQDAGVYPVLLVNAGVPAATQDAIEDLGIEQVVILGGTAAVPTSVETELEDETGNPAVRLAGQDRFGTAVEIADASITGFGFDATDALIANGRVFADALAGGPLGGLREAPILLTDAPALNDQSSAWLADHSDTVDTVTALGGTAAVSDNALDQAEAAAETPGDTRVNETYVVTPQENTDNASGDTVTFVATVPGTVDIVLVPCENVSTTAAGNTVFVNSNDNTIADAAADGAPDDVDNADTEAAISAINGTPYDPTANDDYADDVDPADDGTITIDVDGPGGSSGAECIVLVAFADANSDDALNTSTADPGVPTENFGTSGHTTFSPGAAGVGSFEVDVDSNPDANDRFVGCDIVVSQPEQADPDSCATFVYDANDTFQITDNGVAETVDLATFETALSAGDDVKGSYATETSGTSTFNLFHDEAPEPPTESPLPGSPSADENGVTFQFFESSRTTVDKYRLYRAKLVNGACPAVDADAQSTAPYTNVKTVDDPTPNDQGPDLVEITDTTGTPGTTYCYSLASVDDGDPGPLTTPIQAMRSEAAPGAPTITQADGLDVDGDGALTTGDIHELTFSEAMADDIDTTGTYTVTGTPISQPTEIDCSDAASATCELSANKRVLRITINADHMLVLYDLTITATSGMQDPQGNETDVAGSDDVTIGDSDDDTGEIDAEGPMILAANFPQDSDGASGFGQTDDVLELTFDQDIVLNVADADDVTFEELVAILGPDMTGTALDDPAYGPGTQVTAEVDGATLTLSVVETLAHGVETGDKIPGSDTDVITDTSTFHNHEQPNPSPTTLPAS